ncbi:MAG: pyruvate:ferredoxin (flavodoxin) oxidoreductase [Propionicimonas sp.]|uniref:pyruvate:ferredoxin (flavodoxin) oxidoreductase n=1 Tax=Propionicimonas sp. TaxID=1955623 RepID=UPI003D0C9C2D
MRNDPEGTTAGGPARATLDGNEAAARVAHALSEVLAIYPITPSSAMGESADAWSAAGRTNLWGSVPEVVELQSEAGAAGALHGAVTKGVLGATFTASQGLLLMLPNMYKIAGELTPAVIHVAARTVATHALSIFGDHSDVMAARTTGWAMLCASSVQEAHDFALVAHAATLRTRVPFVHFFDGFRTSHEVNTIDLLADADLRALVREEDVLAHRSRGLTPDAPVVRGVAENPDTFFQAAEAANPFHFAVPEAVAEVFDELAGRTGRRYSLVDYHGAPDAERVVVAMGSAAGCLAETVDELVRRGEKVGLVTIRLYRPFPVEAFLAALPPSVRSIAVLDRTKEVGAPAEPLHADVLVALAGAALRDARFARSSGSVDSTVPEEQPRNEAASRRAAVSVIGGRYGLSSKEFTPPMAKAVFDELAKDAPKPRFTVGIVDDVTHLSLTPDAGFAVPEDAVSAVFYGLGSDGTVGAAKNSVKIIGARPDAYAQGYFVYDSRKSGAVTVSHLRFGNAPIRSTYLVGAADFVGVHQFGLLASMKTVDVARPGATLLLNSPYGEDTWEHLPVEVQAEIAAKRLRTWVIDAEAVAKAAGLGKRINTVMQPCFFYLSGVLPADEAVAAIKASVEKTYGLRGRTVVERNFAAIDAAIAALRPLPAGLRPSSHTHRLPALPDAAGDFVKRVTGAMLHGQGDLLPVSAVPVDGTWPTGTSKWEKRGIAAELPVWDPSLCIDCGKCAVVCPHAAIRIKLADPADLTGAPEGFRDKEFKDRANPGRRLVVQVAPDDCTGCGICSDICPARDKSEFKHKSLDMLPAREHREAERANFDFFLGLPEVDRTQVRLDQVKGVAQLQPLFEFSLACSGCGETPYIKTLTQLFGDRMVIANATGCSSIFGGNLPTTPYTTNPEGRGPAWSNSLFEDNAEFGLGMRIAWEHQHTEAVRLLEELRNEVGHDLADAILSADQSDEAGLAAQRARVADLKRALATHVSPVPEERAQRASRSAGDVGVTDALRDAGSLASSGAGSSGSVSFTVPEERAAGGVVPTVPEERAQRASRRAADADASGITRNTAQAAARLLSLADELVEKSVWIVGGDGWAYDIGYGGLDHVLGSGRNVNILVLDTEVYSNTGGQASKASPRGATAKFATAGKSTPKKDLGMLAQAYGNVYVAQLAIGANHQQTVRAMLEAQAWPGPSLLIAYSTCIAHGIDMATSMSHQTEAVSSGYWPLYRFRPGGDGHPLHLDSRPPSTPVRDFMLGEARFAMLARANPARAEELAALAQADADERWHYYSQLAGVERALPAVKEEP